MKPEQAKALLPIITAFAGGKKVEYHDGTDWMPINEPTFTPTIQWRIAPEPDPYAELKAAQAAGKVIQANIGSAEKPHFVDAYLKEFFYSLDKYRVKPEPKRVLMTSEDLPDGPIWLNLKGNAELMYAIDADGFLESESMRGTPELMHRDGITWSPSHKGPWNSFMKEVEE